jgi:hypothetical protein
LYERFEPLFPGLSLGRLCAALHTLPGQPAGKAATVDTTLKHRPGFEPTNGEKPVSIAPPPDVLESAGL